MIIFCLTIISLALAQDEEVVSMSTPECNPAVHDCQTSCRDVAPEGASCEYIASNNLCSSQNIVSGNFCEKSCGTCSVSSSQCLRSKFGCECLGDWEYSSKKFSGCANPDDDKLGPWCQIKPGSCSQLDSNSWIYPKIYDYCNSDCTSAPPPSCSSAQEAPQPQNQEPGPIEAGQQESNNFNIKIGAVGTSVLTIVNQGTEEVDLTGWTLEDQWSGGLAPTASPPSSLEFGNAECKGKIPTKIKSGKTLRLTISTSRTCSLTKLYRTVVITDDLGRIISEVKLSKFSVTNTMVVCLNATAEYELIPGSQCQYY